MQEKTSLCTSLVKFQVKFPVEIYQQNHTQKSQKKNYFLSILNCKKHIQFHIPYMLHKPSQYKKENRIYNIYKNILPKFTETSLLHIQKTLSKK